MAQQGTIATQLDQGYITSLESGLNNTFATVNQHPRQRESFPLKLHINWILAFSILKCIFGSCLVIIGTWNRIGFGFDPVVAPIWCGSIIFANGLIGYILTYKRNKCLTGAFLGISITSLILAMAMLSFYVMILVRYVEKRRVFCKYEEGWGCSRRLVNAVILVLIFMIACDLGCSIGSIVVSCKASYCTCFGCCECDTVPSNLHQDRQLFQPVYYNDQVDVLPSVQQRITQHNRNHLRSNASGQTSAASVIYNPNSMFGGKTVVQPAVLNTSLPSASLTRPEGHTTYV